MADYTKEIEKRRTFAIISHPDAGKTTLTEKFLLYGGSNQPGRIREGEGDGATRCVRLDGDRKRAWNFGDIFRAAV